MTELGEASQGLLCDIVAMCCGAVVVFTLYETVRGACRAISASVRVLRRLCFRLYQTVRYMHMHMCMYRSRAGALPKGAP